MKSEMRRIAGATIFVVGTFLCGMWGHAWVSNALSLAESNDEARRETIGFSVAVLAPIVILIAPAITFWLTRSATPSWTASALRKGQVASIAGSIAVGAVSLLFRAE